MKKVILTILLGLLASGGLFAADKLIVTAGNDPGCFQLPNTGVQAAIQAAIRKAEAQCDNPVLRDLNVVIRQDGGCNPSNVQASFACLGEVGEVDDGGNE